MANKRFDLRPVTTSDIEMAFPASVLEIMPDYQDVPEEFRKDRALQNEIVNAWFFKGLNPQTEFTAADGIDRKAALRHIKRILGSWEPKHEHKTAAVAYLLSLWFKEIRNWKKE